MSINIPMSALMVRLGLNLPKGFSRRSQIAQVPEIFELLEGLTGIYNRHSNLESRELQTSVEFKRDCDELLHKLGPDLWPDIRAGKKLPIWLLEPSPDLRELYPKRLRYSNRSDREAPSERFRVFVCKRLYNHIVMAKSNSKATSHVLPGLDSQACAINHNSREPDHSSRYEDPPRFDGNSNLENLAQIPADRAIAGLATSSPAGIMPSSSAPPAPTMISGTAMGNTQVKLNETAAEHTHVRPEQCINRDDTRNRSRLGLSSSDAATSSSPFFDEGTVHPSVTRFPHQVTQPLSLSGQAPPSAERTVDIEMHTPAMKKRKRTWSDKLQTQSAHRSPFSFAGEDELVVAGPSTRPVGPQLLGNPAMPGPEFRQQTIQRQSASEELRTASRRESNDETNSPVVQSPREDSALPRYKGKGKGRAAPSVELSANSSDQDRDTIAQFRKEWSITEEQSSDETLSVALRLGSAEEVAAQIMARQHSQMSDQLSPRVEQDESLSTGVHATKQDVVIDLCSSSEDEDTKVQPSSNAVDHGNLAERRQTFAMPGASQRHDSMVGVTTNRIADTGSQQPLHPEAGHILQGKAAANVDVCDLIHLNNILGRVSVKLHVRRADNTILPLAYITLEQIPTSEVFFRAAENEFQGMLMLGEKFVRARMTQTNGTWLPDMDNGFTLDRESRRNITWEVWLTGLRAVFERDPIAFGITMRAEILVTEPTGARV